MTTDFSFLDNGFFYGINKLIYLANYYGYARTIYLCGTIFSGVLCILYTILIRKRYGIPPWKSIVIPNIEFPVCYGLAIILTYLETGCERFGGANVVRAYAFYPIVYYFVAKLVKVEPRRNIDYRTMPSALAFVFAHLFCPITGCCYGYPCSWGIYNPDLKMFLFPNQYLESILALAVFIGMYFYQKKRNFRITGKYYPIFLIVQGTIRFFMEFLRNEEKLFWHISDLALNAVVMIIVGIVWLIVDKKKTGTSVFDK